MYQACLFYPAHKSWNTCLVSLCQWLLERLTRENFPVDDESPLEKLQEEVRIDLQSIQLHNMGNLYQEPMVYDWLQDNSTV